MTLQTARRQRLEEHAAALNTQYADADATRILAGCAVEHFENSLCLVSSFGAESAVLISLALEAKRDLPIVFIDTLRHFEDTSTYVDILRRRLAIENLTVVQPRNAEIQSLDPDAQLFGRDADQCCHIRKTLPMLRALSPYRAWISGRKRYQSSTRTDLHLFEVQDRWIKVNPLAEWTAEMIGNYARNLDLPPHPLVARGYLSIGCEPCTRPVAEGETDPRAGRWADSEKTECGIHFEDGKVVRTRQKS